jgi:hypothetical protein
MIFTHFITHGLFYGAVMNGYLFLMMVTTSPRVWEYSDSSAAIKSKVPAQTRGEKRLGLILVIPWLLFVLGFPIYSTLALKGSLGGEIPFWMAFLNVFIMALLGTLGDLVVLDWLVVSRITPKFVIIPGTVKEDYKDFSHHYRAHARAAPALILLCLVIAGLVCIL